MSRTTQRVMDYLPQGFSAGDLKLAKWFLDIVAPLYPRALHSHATAILVSDGKGRRRPASRSALFHEQWPRVQMGDILTALAHVGFITSPQRVKEPATNEGASGYVFRLTPRDHAGRMNFSSALLYRSVLAPWAET
jgi:hypothetical protein